MNKSQKNIQILITTVTLSSANLAKDELERFENTIHRFFPLDVEFLIKEFLNLWKPSVIFLVDSEIWPNLILSAKSKKIPLCVINARITKKSYNRWLVFSKTAKKIFNSINLFLTSNLETKNFLNNLSIKNVIYNGNIKFIGQIDTNKTENLNKNILQKSRFWIAASTHKGEENFCFQTHLKTKEKYPDLITIIFPRHINRANQIKKLSERYNLNTQILNKNDVLLENKEIIIINTFGELQKYFHYAKSVFIGKSMIKKLKNQGGQNPIEAAKLDCKIYHGPYVYNFEEIYEILEKNNISKKIETPEQLSFHLVKDLINLKKEQKDYSKLVKNLGDKILVNTMKDINNLMTNEIQ